MLRCWRWSCARNTASQPCELPPHLSGVAFVSRARPAAPSAVVGAPDACGSAVSNRYGLHRVRSTRPGTEGSRRAQGMVNAPFGFSAVGSADNVVAQLDAGGGGFARIQQVVAAASIGRSTSGRRASFGSRTTRPRRLPGAHYTVPSARSSSSCGTSRVAAEVARHLLRLGTPAQLVDLLVLEDLAAIRRVL